MHNKYGGFPTSQFEHYKQYLHNKIHWLLLYKDPKCDIECDSKSIEDNFTSLQLQLAGLNSLLNYPPVLITLMTLIESSYNGLKQENFDFPKYRKLLLDAHSMVDKL